MIAADSAIEKIEGIDLQAFNLRLSGAETAAQDKRIHTRTCGVFQLNCENYNSDSDTFETSDGFVKNYSFNGLYFETKNPFPPGEPVYLSTKDRLSDRCNSELVIGVHAQVVWCKKLGTDFDPGYGVGVMFFEPI